MAIVKKMFEPVKQESELIKQLKAADRERDLKKIREYNARFKKIK